MNLPHFDRPGADGAGRAVPRGDAIDRADHDLVDAVPITFAGAIAGLRPSRREQGRLDHEPAEILRAIANGLTKLTAAA